MPDTTPITLAAIDTGSNAIRVIIANAVSPAELAIVEAERVPIRLGHHTFTHGELDRRSIEDAVTAFARFRKLFEQHHVARYRAVATSALRNASNREDLLDRIYRDVGIEVEVIDGQEEARLVRKAVLQAVQARPVEVIVDLGGGSLEVSIRHGDNWETSSMRIGTVRLLETFGLSGAISDDEARMIRRFVTSTLARSVPGAESVAQGATAIACGGNAEAIASLFGNIDKHGVPGFKASSLEEALPKVLSADIDKRIERLSVRRDRAEVIGVAGLVFATVADTLKLKRFSVPGVGIREGVLLDLAEASIGELSSSSDSHTIAMARTFAARIGHNTTHGEQVRRIATILFTQLKEVHGLEEAYGDVLQLAALLHDIGEVVHRRGHHKHTEYLILNGRIPGLNSPDRELVAAVARAHRRSLPSARKHQVYANLGEDRQAVVRRLAALLRVADELDTDHRQRIIAVNCEVRSKKVILHISLAAEDESPVPGVLRKTQLFEAEFGLRVEANFTEVAARPNSALQSE